MRVGTLVITDHDWAVAAIPAAQREVERAWFTVGADYRVEISTLWEIMKFILSADIDHPAMTALR